MWCGVCHGLQCGNLLQSSPPWDARGDNLIYQPLLAVEFLLWYLEDLLLSLSRLGICRAVYLTFFLVPFSHSCCAMFLLFPTYIFTEMPPSWLRGSSVSCNGSIGADWNCLYLAQSCPDLSSLRPPCSRTCYQHLAMCNLYRLLLSLWYHLP